MDVLDPAEVAGHSLNVAGGPSSAVLAAAIEALCSHPKVAAFGVASYPSERDPEKISLRAAYALIQGAIRGARRAAAGRAGTGN